MDPQILSEISSYIEPTKIVVQQTIYRNTRFLLEENTQFSHAIKYMGKLVMDFISMRKIKIDFVVGVDCFTFCKVAEYIGCSYIVMDEQRNIQNATKFEYYENREKFLCIKNDIIPPGSNVLLVDNVIASGNKIWASSELMKMIGSNLIGCVSLVQLVGIELNEKLSPEVKLLPLIKYQHDSISKNIDPVLNNHLYTFIEEYYPPKVQEHIEKNDNAVMFIEPHKRKMMKSISFEITIYVSSHDQQILEAVYNAFSISLNTNSIVVYGLNVNSFVSKQPIGHEQTRLGCWHRFLNMKKYLDSQSAKYNYLVSIENGIIGNTIDNFVNKKIVADISYYGKIFDFSQNRIFETSSLCLNDDKFRVMIPIEFYNYFCEIQQYKIVNETIDETINEIIDGIVSGKTMIDANSFYQYYNKYGLTKKQIISKFVESLMMGCSNQA